MTASETGEEEEEGKGAERGAERREGCSNRAGRKGLFTASAMGCLQVGRDTC